MRVDTKRLLWFGRLLAMVAISVALVLIVIKNVAALSNMRTRPDILKLAGSFLLMMLSYVAPASIWHVLSRKAGASVGYIEAIHLWSVSQFGKYIPGAMLVVVKRARQYGGRGLDWRTVLHCFLVENLVVADAAFLTAGVFGGLSFLGARQWAILAPAMAIVSILVLFPPVTRRLLSILSRRAREDDGVASNPGFPGMLFLFGLGSLSFLLSGMGLHLLVRAITSLTTVTVTASTGAVAGAGFASLLVVLTPGGLGTREFFLTVMLDSDMPASLAVVIAAASRLMMTACELILPALTWAISRIRRERGRENETWTVRR